MATNSCTTLCRPNYSFSCSFKPIPKSNYPLRGYKNTLASVEAINNNLRQIQQQRQLNLVAFITEMPAATPTKCNSNMQLQQQQPKHQNNNNIQNLPLASQAAHATLFPLFLIFQQLTVIYKSNVYFCTAAAAAAAAQLYLADTF